MYYSEKKHSVHRYRFNPIVEGIVVAFVSLVSLQTVIYFLYFHSRQAQIGEIKDGLVRTVAVISSSLDIEGHKQLKNSNQQGTPLYKELLIPLERAKSAGGDEIEFIYTVIDVNPAGAKEKDIRFILDAAKQGDHDGDGVEDKSFVMDPYEDAPVELMEALDEGLHKTSTEPYTDSWGTHMNAYYPLYDNCVLAIDISANKFAERLRPIKIATDRARVAAVVISFLFGLVTWFLRNFAKTINNSRVIIAGDFKKHSEECEKNS